MLWNIPAFLSPTMGCVRANRSKHLSKSTKVTGRGKESETSGRGLSLEQWFSTKEWLGPSVDFGNVWRPFLVVPAVVLVGRRKCHWHLVIEAWDAVAHPRRHNHPAPNVGNAKEVEKPALQRNFVVLVTAAFLFAEKASQNLHVPLGPRNWVSSHVPET